MKKFIGFIFLIFITIIGWRIGNSLSSDAISMAIGVMFGVLAGIPTALLVLATGRNDDRSARPHQFQQSMPALPNQGAPYYAPQPPVIIVTGQTDQAPLQVDPYQQSTNQLEVQQPVSEDPSHRESRHFRVVGESEEWVDGW